MLPQLNKIKGIHPGTLLKWELEQRKLKSSELAVEIGEHKQTISAIINKRRSINPSLSIKLGRYFKTDNDYFMLVQSSYDVKQLTQTEKGSTPNLDKIRRVLFWDTDFDKIDWNKNKRAIIQRVLERGNDTEINEIIAFYSRKTVSREIRGMRKSHLPSFAHNIKAYELV